jgi:uncharacterized protein (UPF0332 family)
MNVKDFLAVADELLDGSTEASWRSAVSRAYYAAFHAARDLLRRCGFSIPRADQAHAYPWLRLANCGRIDVQSAGAELHELRQARNWADYDLDRPFGHLHAANQVGAATDLIRLLDDLAATPAILAQVIDVLRVYERDVLREVTWQAPAGHTP